MQAIPMIQQSSAVAPWMSEFGQALYATNTGVDHPTPVAPDRGSSKPKPKPAKPTKKS